VTVAGPLVLGDDQLKARAALEGAGLAYVSASDVSADITAGRLVSVLEEWCPKPICFFLFYPSRRQMPQALRVFIDAINSE